MEFPAPIREIMGRFTTAGFSCYAVGGCTRDALLSRPIHDWDLTTSALPEETMRLFPDCRIVPTGLAHGTLTLLMEGMAVEVTTYRLDGMYTDHRRPESVTFTRSLENDLRRRDFTINAIACSENEQVDLFGGAEDLQNRCIRCIGVPEWRFDEDGLRILRGLRFASELDFAIHPDTAAAIHACRELLSSIAAERIREELIRLLDGPGVSPVLREYRDVLAVFLPELPTGCAWEQTIRRIDASPEDPVVRIAALLWSRSDACDILRRLRFDRDTIHAVATLLAAKELPVVPEDASLRRLLSRFDAPMVSRLISLQRADRISRDTACDVSDLTESERLCSAILARGDCLTLHDLAISGEDLLALGIPHGKQIGALLSALLDAVLAGECPNRRDALLRKARTLSAEGK